MGRRAITWVGAGTLVAVLLGSAVAQDAKKPDATLRLSEGSVAVGIGWSWGKGTLMYKGKAYPLKVEGLSVGEVGVTKAEARGDVFNLKRVEDFPGTYGQARYGFAIGTESGGDLWLQNEQGVILHLKAKRTGLMLTLGGDAVVISMNPQ